MKKLTSSALICSALAGCLPAINIDNSGQLESFGSASAILVDHNRDGKVDAADNKPGAWDWNSGGAFMLADIVDADGNHTPDYLDKGPRTPAMLKQFVDLRITANDTVKFTHNGGDHVLVYSENGQQEIKSGSSITGPTTLKIAAKYFAGINNFSGYVRFTAEGNGSRGEATVRVAPWIMLPNSAKTKKLFIAQGVYASAGLMQADLRKEVAVQPFSTGMWEEMWMQDTIEIGYQEVPGKGFQYAALQADRCTNKECDHFANTLLNAETGVFRVKAHPRKNFGNWDDWYGNLEVSHPTSKWRHGRIYHGKNLNENLAGFLKQQEVQKPFILDPTWLLIKHVDEFLNFLTDNNGNPKIMVTSPRRASEINGKALDKYNQDIQNRIDRDLGIALTAVGLSSGDVIHLPMLYSQGGENDWSSPVNSVHLNRSVAVGNTSRSGPKTLAQTAYGKDIENSFREIGLRVIWTDDRAYQRNHGNVHCGTNTMKEPVFRNFWDLPVKG